MPKGYVLAELEITDPVVFEDYRGKVSAAIALRRARQCPHGAAATRRVVLRERRAGGSSSSWPRSRR